MNPLFDLLCACLKASKHFNKTFFSKIIKNLAPFNTTFFFLRLKLIFSSKYFFHAPIVFPEQLATEKPGGLKKKPNTFLAS